MKVIFLGTPDFAIPSLEALIKTFWIELIAICTQTDKEAGRGKEIQEPPVKKFAKEHNLLCLQTKKIAKEEDVIQKIKDLKPEIMITCAFGQILSQEILDIPTLGVINVHASLLPKYRGAAPINWAILSGEKETGITIMKTTVGLDSGPIILQEKCEINDDETSSELSKKLSMLGASSLIKALELIKDGGAKFISQDDSKATKAPMLKKELGLIDWSKTAQEIHNKIRGLQPWPSAFTYYHGKIIKLWASRDAMNRVSATDDQQKILSGTITEISDYLKVKTNDGYINIYKLQSENKKIVNAKDWANGARIKVGDKFE
ncbi:MAG: methionyl-tRNA formyltransferase [Candidatus Melainabacteria bacterium]|nr:methionyl-tRNA formyltransferase [Candidatus Melainabacteria bacterium]